MEKRTQSFAGATESGVMEKKFFQQLRRDFKKQGFPVEKVAEGRYECRHPKNDKLLLVALNGRNNYLVRSVKGLYSVQEKA